MKKIIFSILGAILLIFGCVYFYIASIDWNNHRERIMEQIMDATGKKVVFEGDLNFSIFPKPYLQARDVKIYNDGEEAPLAEIPELVSQLELMPFIHGNIQVVKMTMKNPTIYFSVSKDGMLNWQKTRQVDGYENYSAEMALNSVMMEDAVVKISNENNTFSETFDNVTAEVTAESMKGPYRIEGNFVEDDQPIGFAFSIGQHLEGIATGVNVAITHPSSESYIRFDGSMMLKNNAFTGNIIAESQQPLFFLRKILNLPDLTEEFNNPLMISTELKSNKNRLDLANFIIKYGKSAGAGNIMIPLTKAKPVKGSKKNAVLKPKIEASFEMTDLDLDVMREYLKNKFLKYQDAQEKFSAKYNYDVAFDLKSLKTYYNNYELQNFALSADILNDIITVKQFSVLVPGNTKIAARGRAYEADEQLTYKMEVGLATEDMQRFLFLLDINPKIVVPSTYKNAQAGFTISGTPHQMNIDPITLIFDKMNFSGTMSLIYDIRDSIYISLETPDPINLDNYFYSLPEDTQNGGLAERLYARYEQLGFLNDKDWFLKLKVPAGILDKTYFGETYLDAEIINGYMNVKEFTMSDIDQTNISMSGGLSGFGEDPQFDKMDFTVVSQNFRTLWSDIKFTDMVPALFDTDTFRGRGVVSGNSQDINLKILGTLGNIDFVYDGKLYNNDANPEKFDGSIEIKSQNLSSFASSIGYDEIAGNLSNSIFSISGQILGNPEGFRFDDFEFLVAGNGANGSLNIDLAGEKPNLSGSIYFGEIDFKDFLISKKDAAERSFAVMKKELQPDLLQKPEFDSTSFSYNLFNFADFNGNVQIKRAYYNNSALNDLSAKLSVKDGKIQATDITANLDPGFVSGKFAADTSEKNDIKGVFSFKDYPLWALNIMGSKYGIESGTTEAQIEFASSVDSASSFFENLTGRLTAQGYDLRIKGIDLEKVYSDLETRQRSDGLLLATRGNLQSGVTQFGNFNINMNIAKNQWTFENSQISSPKYVSGISGYLDPRDWIMDVTFDISFPSLKEIPKMYLTLKESAANPEVHVSVNEIAEKYDNYWNAIAQEQEQRRIEDENRRREIMNSSISKYRSMQRDLQEIVLPNLSAMAGKVSDNAKKEEYNSLSQQADGLQNEINGIIQMENKDYFSDDDLRYVNDKYGELYAAVEKIRSSMDGMYENDMKAKYDTLYDEIISFYRDVKSAVLTFRSGLIHYDGEGKRAYPQIVFDEDKTHVTVRDRIEENYVAIDSAYSRILDEYYNSSSNKSLYQLEQSNNEVEQKLNEMRGRFEEMKKDMEDCINYMKMRLDGSDKKEDKKPEKTEEKKKSSDGKTSGKILREVGGKVVTTGSKDEEDSEKTPQEINLHKVDGQTSETVKGTISKSGGQKQQSKQKEKENASSFLKKVAGETNNVTGTIKKK